MTHPDHDRDRDEPVTVTDKRRIDPQTGEVREGAPAGPAPNGPASGPFAGETPEEADKAAELLGDLQRVQADFANYRKRALRDQELAGERAKAVVVNQLLPVLDDLERAHSHGDLETSPLKAVADKLVAVLTGLGLVGFGVEGEEFDRPCTRPFSTRARAPTPSSDTSCGAATDSAPSCCDTHSSAWSTRSRPTSPQNQINNHDEEVTQHGSTGMG